MQLLVAKVSIKALQSVDPTLVGKVVPCSEPIITSSALSTCSFSIISFFVSHLQLVIVLQVLLNNPHYPLALNHSPG